MIQRSINKWLAFLLSAVWISTSMLANLAYADSSSSASAASKQLNAAVERQSDGSLKISWQASTTLSGNVSVYWSDTPDHFSKSHLLKTLANAASITVSDPNPSARSYFLVEAGSLRATASERKVNLQGAYNFRDLGGYATSDGRKVKWGSLYRSEQLNNLTDSDKQYLIQSGLKTVVDYRADSEIATAPDPVITGVNEVKDPVTQDINSAFNSATFLSMTTDQAIAAFESFQRLMVTSPQTDAYKKLFQLLLDPNNVALVQHCTAGKDRTGLGSALILLALGVPEDTVMNDYLLSNTYRATANQQQLAAMTAAYHLNATQQQVMAIVLGVQKEFLQASLDQIKADYGSYTGFFQNALGLSTQDLQQLKSMYLESASPTGFLTASYVNSTVNATVYSNVYANAPTLSIYNPSGNLLNTVPASSSSKSYTAATATYTYQYNFTSYVDDGYGYVRLLENVTGSVYASASHLSVDTSGGSGHSHTASSNSGSASGGGTTPATTPSSFLKISPDGKVDGTWLADSLKQFNSIQLQASGSNVVIPASAVAGYAGGAKTIVIQAGYSTYQLPLQILKPEELAKALGTDASNLSIQVSITALPDSQAAALKAAAEALHVSTVGQATDFQVNLIGQDGRSLPLSLGSTYVSRSLSLVQYVDPKNATGALFDPVSKTLRFVPTVFSYKDGVTTATMKRPGNSIYTIVQADKTFPDVPGHWAEESIHLLVNKLVADGVDSGRFEPDRSIMRAEFAAMVARSLGLAPSEYHATFTDISSNDWYAGELGAAVNAGIINGYEDGTFRPNAPINREELTVMIMRAIAFAGAKAQLSSNEQAAALAPFQDGNSIGWSRSDIAAAVRAGILNGMTDQTLALTRPATRAEAASMIGRFLTAAGFIN